MCSWADGVHGGAVCRALRGPSPSLGLSQAGGGGEARSHPVLFRWNGDNQLVVYFHPKVSAGSMHSSPGELLSSLSGEEKRTQDTSGPEGIKEALGQTR